jgi:hypothetical protein
MKRREFITLLGGTAVGHARAIATASSRRYL